VLEVFRSAGFTGKVTVSRPATTPARISVIGDPVVVAPAGQASNFVLKVKRKVPPGSYGLVFTATDNTGELHDATLTVVVQ
jgi:hypothetical protein